MAQNKVSENPRITFTQQGLSDLYSLLRSFGQSINRYADGYLSSVVAVSANYTCTINDGIVMVTTGGTGKTITLPAANQAKEKVIIVVKCDTSAATITVQAASGNINGAASTTVTGSYGVKQFASDGSNYFVVSAS